MDEPYKLATVEYRGRVFPVVEVAGALFDLGVGYERFKAAAGRRDFFKASHGYTMLDVLEEWELFDEVLGDFAGFLAGELAGLGVPYAYRTDEVRFMPPILYPDKILNAGSNYYDHSLEMGAAAPDRDNHEPYYFFYKGSRHTVAGHVDQGNRISD